MANAGQSMLFKKGQLLFKEGDPSTGLYFIKSGLIEVFKQVDNQDFDIEAFGPGEIIGTFTLILRTTRTASAKALEDSEVEFYSLETFNKTITAIPEWIMVAIKDMLLRIKKMNEKYIALKISEKRILSKYENLYHLSSQVAYLFVFFIRNNQGEEHASYLFGNFFEQASLILSKEKKIISEIFNIFRSNNLI